MNTKPTALAFAAACLCTLAHNAQAVEWKFSGYGTVAAVHSTEDKADVVNVIGQETGAGYSNEWDTAIGTRFGAQLDAKFSSQWSASGQLVSKFLNNSFAPKLATGFIRFAPGAGVEIRAGRLPYSAFQVSDYLNIGYSYPWVTPPADIYAVSFPHVDGLDLTWRTSVGPVGVKLQGATGKSKQTQGNLTMTLKDLAGVNATADLGDFSTRLSYITYLMTIDQPNINAAFNAIRAGIGFGPPPFNPTLGQAVADEYEFKDKRAAYLSWGASYDPGDWFVNLELGMVKRVSFSPKSYEAALTAGLRRGNFTPYAVLSKFHPAEKLQSNNAIASNFINTYYNRGEQTTSLGLRWDFSKSADFKVQYDRVNLDEGSIGFLRAKPGLTSGGTYGVVSAAVDFVF